MISIIIPSYNHFEDLKRCIDSIIKHTTLNENIEIIVVAQVTNEEQRKKYEEYLTHECVKSFYYNEGLGYTRAVNIGVAKSQAKSQGDVLIMMNNDVELLPQEKDTWINYLINPLKDDVGITCNLKIWDESVERMFAVFFLCAFPRRIWDLVGGLDEVWSPGGGEDIEFCIKVEQLGYKIIQVPDEINEVKNGINVNRFPSYHVGESTMLDPEHRKIWEEHILQVRKRLEYLYRLPEGWFYKGDVDEYRRLVEDVPVGGVIGELGCYKGRSLCSVADIIKRKKLRVVVVDIFTGTDCEVKEENYRHVFEENIKRFGIKDQVKIIERYTNDAVKIIPDGLFNLLFIDASHLYEDVKKDLENWEQKVKTNGTISGHDYGNWEGVGRAVNERYTNIRINSEHFGIDSGIAVGSVWSKRL